MKRTMPVLTRENAVVKGSGREVTSSELGRGARTKSFPGGATERRGNQAVKTRLEHWVGQGQHFHGAWLGALVLGMYLAGGAATLQAAHYVNEGFACYSCHSLSAAEAEPDTSMIASASRGGFVGLMKGYNGGRCRCGSGARTATRGWGTPR